MKIFKKILTISLILIITITLYNFKTISTNSNFIEKSPVKVGVLLYNFDDLYMSIIKQNLEDIQKKNEGKVEYTFFDGKNNLSIQNEIIDSLTRSNYDLLLINLVEKREDLIKDILYKTNQNNIPIIIFNTPIDKTDVFKPYTKSIIINLNLEQPANLQGQILVNAWNTNKEAIDKNKDNIMQYVMLKGKPDSIETTVRTKNSILSINNAGIQTQEIASLSANWSKEFAKNALESLFLRYGNSIEVIIANNDAMAIGAIEALQRYGYNMGDKSKTIPVVGIDGIPAAQELIEKGFMTGTAYQDIQGLSEALYTVGMNLATGKNPIEGTNYQLDNTGVTITLPYKEYKSSSVS